MSDDREARRQRQMTSAAHLDGHLVRLVATNRNDFNHIEIIIATAETNAKGNVLAGEERGRE